MSKPTAIDTDTVEHAALYFVLQQSWFPVAVSYIRACLYLSFFLFFCRVCSSGVERCPGSRVHAFRPRQGKRVRVENGRRRLCACRKQNEAFVCMSICVCATEGVSVCVCVCLCMYACVCVPCRVMLSLLILPINDGRDESTPFGILWARQAGFDPTSFFALLLRFFFSHGTKNVLLV